jgi:hypothetical protein
MRAAIALGFALCGAAPAARQDGGGAEAPAPVAPRGVPPLALGSSLPSREEIGAALDRAVGWLLERQYADGSFGGVRNMTYTDFWANVEAHRSWTVATTGLVVMALLRHGGDGERARGAIERGADYLVRHHDLRRCDDWDIDNVWGLLYGLQGLSCALAHPSFAASPRRPAMEAAARRMLERVGYYQSPLGGWGYYADQIDAWRPNWATSFTTAAMIDALCDARVAGLPVDVGSFEKAVRAVARCRLPSGAFTYDVTALPEPGSLEGINDVRGSLSRIQACHHALLRGGQPPRAQELSRGLDRLFRHHMYLDCARMRPIPHEAYHRNAGYFYLFGHFYAGELLPELPPAERRVAAGRLAFEVMKTQERSGAFWDYWMSDYTRPSGTAFAAMALGRALPEVEPSRP